jgi:hypothetical protein
MADKKAEHLNYRESKLIRFGPVQVYCRRDDDDRPTIVDAIHEDERRIATLADRLQHLGYGVMRRRKPRAGRTDHILKARWAGDGPPPARPFADEV